MIGAESVAGGAAGVEGGKRYVGGHHRRDPALHRDGERHQVACLQRLAVGVHGGQGDVAVERGAPVSRIVLRAGEGARALAALDPAADQRRHALGIVAEGAGLHDRILGKHVEVGDRREHPVDAHRAGLLRRDRSGPSGHRGVAQRGERERRRELGESLDLLPRAALEVRGQEKRTLGAPGQIRGEPADALDVPAEDDEAADAELQRVGDRGGLVAEAAVGPGAERGHDEPAGLEIAGHQAGVTEPSTLEPDAPVAEGTLPGCPCNVR